MSPAAPTGPSPSGSHSEPVAPFWAIAAVTWINSLGSGLLWSGVPFVIKKQFGFTETQTLLLALGEAVIYVAVALAAGPLLRRLQARGGSARTWMAATFVVQLLGSLLVFAGQWGVLAAACVLSGVGAALWPVMESYLSSGRHGHDMRRAIGHFNIVWMSATGASLLLMSPILAAGAEQHALLVLAPVSVVSLALLRWFPARPAPHAVDEHRTHVPPAYVHLRSALRFVLPVSYVFISVIGPILPFRLSKLEMAPYWETPLASVWMFVRMFTVVGMAMVPAWHGRWGAIVLGVALLAGGFAAMVLAPNVWTMGAGLAAFGAGHGVLYYAALYYAMAVGSAEVDAGGIFEALIGVGYVVGPIAGLFALGSSSTLAESSPTLITAVWGVAAAGMLPAVFIWHRTRSARLSGAAGSVNPRRNSP